VISSGVSPVVDSLETGLRTPNPVYISDNSRAPPPTSRPALLASPCLALPCLVKVGSEEHFSPTYISQLMFYQQQ
jgi:hypothetical protein